MRREARKSSGERRLFRKTVWKLCRLAPVLLFLFQTSIPGARLQTTMPNAEGSPGVVKPSNGIPCLARFSIFLKGKCMQCIRPNHIDIKCAQQTTANNRNVSRENSLGYDNCAIGEEVNMCVEQEADIEKLKIAGGRNYLNGRILRIVTIERHPFVKLINNKHSGVVFELVYALQEKYNFTSTIFPPYDGNWGTQTANGTWNGMVGQVLRKEADLGAAGFSVTLVRAKVISFSMSYHLEPTAILIPAPQPGSKLTILIRPLSPEVWLAVFTTIMLLVPSLFVMHVVSLRIRGGKVDLHKPVNAIRLIGDLFQFIVGSLVQESITSPVNKTTRFLVVIWWFLTLVVANIYLGYMVSFLSAPKLYDIVENLEGLVHQHTLRWTYRKGTALEDLFQLSTTGIYKAIGMGAKGSDLALTDIDGVEKTLSGRFAFLKEKSYLDVAIGTDFEKTHTCRLTVARETFFTVGLSYIVSKKSAFLDLLDREILNTLTTGLFAKWKQIHWPQNLWCVDAASYIVNSQPKTRKLTIDDCQGAYFVLLCGLSAACAAFVVEIRQLLLSQPCKLLSKQSQIEDLSYKIIVIPIENEYYRKMSNNLFDRKTLVIKKV